MRYSGETFAGFYSLTKYSLLQYPRPLLTLVSGVSASFRVSFSVDRTYRLDSPPIMQGLSVPFACVGSGDPVRVLRLYTTNTLDIFWSIYCWGICTTCHYRSNVLRSSLTLWDFLLLLWPCHSECSFCTVLCGALYTACVDASRTVFWDRSPLNASLASFVLWTAQFSVLRPSHNCKHETNTYSRSLPEFTVDIHSSKLRRFIDCGQPQRN